MGESCIKCTTGQTVLPGIFGIFVQKNVLKVNMVDTPEQGFITVY